MIIDSHLHIGLNGWSEKSLLKYLDTNRIDKGWVLTWDEENPYVPDYYIPLDISLVAKAFKNHPDRIVPFYAPDPTRKNWKEKLQRHLDSGFAGCAELKVPYRWDDHRIISLLEYLDNRKLPLIFHMERARIIFVSQEDKGFEWFFKRLINERTNGKGAYHLGNISRKTGFLKKYLARHLVQFPGYMQDFSSLENALINFKGVKFIAHGPHIWNHFTIPEKEYLFHQNTPFRGKGITWKLLEKHNNLYCDISGFSGYDALRREPEVSKIFFNELYKKILFGTDNLGTGIQKMIESFDIDKDKMEFVYYKNALSIVP